MISVAAIRMQQFGVQFYQASLTASDIDKLVRFEVLSYGEQAQPVRGGRKKAPAAPTKVNWDLLERRIAASDKAYQRQIIRKKIDELVQYYEQCRQARDLPSIAGAVIISCDEPLRFEPHRSGLDARHAEGAGARGHPARDRRAAPAAGAPRRHRSLRRRAVHRSGGDLRPASRGSRRPDVRHDQREAHAAERVAPRVAVGPAAVPRRKPGRGPRHRPRAQRSRGFAALRRDQAARRRQRTRGAGAARAGAEEAVRGRGVWRRPEGRRLPRRVEEVLRQLPEAGRAGLHAAWNGRKYSIKSAAALRAFIRVAPDVVRRLDQEHADRTDFRAIGRVIAPWGRRIGDLRFETEGAWKRSGTTVDSLAKELRLALQYPEGAAV